MDFSRTMMAAPASGGFEDDFAGGIHGVKYEFPGDAAAAGAGSSGLMLMDDYSSSLAGGFAPTSRTVYPGYGLGMMTAPGTEFGAMGSMANPLMSLLQSAFPSSSEMTSPASSEAPVMSDDSMDTAGAMHEEPFTGYGMSSTDMKSAAMGLMPMAMPFEVLTSPLSSKPIAPYDPSLRSKSLTTDEHIVFPPEMYERLADASGALSEPEVDVYSPDSTSLYSFDETGDGEESPEPGAVPGHFDWSFVKDKSRRHRIMRWKEKKSRILSGKSKSRTYYNRQKYAKIRPRVNGRFVSHEEWERMQVDSSEMAGSSPVTMTETSFDMDVAAVEAAASSGLWKGVISGLEPME